MLLRRESLEPPTSQLGHSRHFGQRSRHDRFTPMNGHTQQ
jgi:hypothetical protein